MTIRISAPDTASKGEVIELKAMIQHKMETGYRRDSRGDVVARDIITRFECPIMASWSSPRISIQASPPIPF